MLQFKVTLFKKSTTSIAIILIILTSHRALANEIPVDLEIIEQSDALVPFMTPAQKMAFVKLEAELNTAKSNLRSGKHLVNTKASSFDPDRDLKPIINRGEKLVLAS